MWWNSRPTLRRLLSSSLFLWLPGGDYCGTIVYGLFPRVLERWHERVGSNDGSERRNSTRETQKKEERETPSSRHRNTETFSRDTDDESLENPGHPTPGEQKAASRLPRHCDDNYAGLPSTTPSSRPHPSGNDHRGRVARSSESFSPPDGRWKVIR
jgi:hypothetical protein